MKKRIKKITSEMSQKYFEDIVNSMPGHVYWKNKEGAFLGCNLEQAKDAGFNSSDKMIGKTDYDMPWSIQADYLREIDTKVMNSGRPLTIEEIFELPDGTRGTYLSKKQPLYDDKNQVSGILGISFDITDRKKLEEELVKSKDVRWRNTTIIADDASEDNELNSKKIHLTYREKQIGNLICEGLTAKEASNFLCISQKTVEKHVENIKNKLGIKRRSHLVSYFNYYEKK